MKNKLKRNKSENSMSNASKVICMEDECIGKVSSDRNIISKKNDDNTEKNRKSTRRSSMKFGSGDSCSDEECIGKV